MIEDLLPEGVWSFFTASKFGEEKLLTEELMCTGDLGEKRLQDFATGRYCAHQCLTRVGINQPVLSGASGNPIWPEGILGSISHSEYLTGAIISNSTDYLSLGLDIETIGRVEHDLWFLFFTQSEIRQLESFSLKKQYEMSTVFFSVKEAYYKMQYPITRTFMDFHECEIQSDGENYLISSEKDNLPPLLHGRRIEVQYVQFEEEIISWVLLHRDQSGIMIQSKK